MIYDTLNIRLQVKWTTIFPYYMYLSELVNIPVISKTILANLV